MRSFLILVMVVGLVSDASARKAWKPKKPKDDDDSPEDFAPAKDDEENAGIGRSDFELDFDSEEFFGWSGKGRNWCPASRPRKMRFHRFLPFLNELVQMEGCNADGADDEELYHTCDSEACKVICAVSKTVTVTYRYVTVTIPLASRLTLTMKTTFLKTRMSPTPYAGFAETTKGL